MMPALKKERIGRSRGLSRAGRRQMKCPREPREHNDIVVLISDFPLEAAGNRIKPKNFTTPELANYELLTEAPKVGWSQDQTKWGIEPVTML
jgi:hypothetical protein